jgi:nucleoid-associated protein YgaU
VVKTGDSLWSIAAAELGPNATAEAIAGRWPQWYEANRQLIGPNPNLIIPGQVLNPPAPSHPVPPTHQEK